MAIQTHLGKDKLLLTSLTGEEAISEQFSYEIEMLSLDPAIDAADLIGRNVKLTLHWHDTESRPINGMVGQWRVGPLVSRGLRIYRARIVPWSWFLGHTADCRIFQNMNVPDIIEQVFKTYNYPDYEMAVSRDDYPKLEFCVQYRESALNFVCRLMEQAGIFYFFRHEENRHVLIIADKNVTFQDLLEKRLTYSPSSTASGIVPGLERQVQQWEHTFDFQPGHWAHQDFNFEIPSTDLRTTEKTVLKLRGADTLERYDYPGGYTDKGLGGKLTRTRMEAEEAAHHAVRGTSTYQSLATGGKFTLQRHPFEDDRKLYVSRRVRHHATENGYLNDTEESRYHNDFEAIPFDVPFRPLRTTEKPFVHGPQTAMVVGPPGEAIFTDKHGRVRVHFHWDRYGKRDDTSSCWIRVSQAWAGRGWGSVNLPHVGHEVVVSFLEGDPDRPLITGRVYNGESGTAMGMPADKTQSGMRDHSGNEILMEGKSGAQDIRVHAVKDMHVTVDDNRVMHVKSHLTETVDKGQEVTIAKGYKETITDSATSTISGGLTTTVNGKWDSTVNGKLTEKITEGEDRTISAGQKLTVTGGSKDEITGERSIAVTGNLKQSTTTTTDLHATGAGTYTSEANLKFAVAGSVIEITLNAITISTGPSTIKLDASGVAVSGPKISLNG